MKHVLFGARPGWTERIQKTIDPARFNAEFRDFRDPDIAFDEYDIVVPLLLSDYKHARARSRRHANCLYPHDKVIALAHNKQRYNEFLLTDGFAQYVPQIYTDAVSYPFIYKKAEGIFGMEARIIHTPEEMIAFEAEVNDPTYFKQEYVGGRIEYVLHIITLHGRPRYTVTYEHGFNKDHYIKGKWAHYVTHREIETPFLDVFCGILEKLDYSGTACFNFKIVDGVPKIFEMNPRCGATIVLEINNYLETTLAVLAEQAGERAIIAAE
jgi:carbamoylphosphate synthase large subunit